MLSEGMRLIFDVGMLGNAVCRGGLSFEIKILSGLRRHRDVALQAMAASFRPYSKQW